MHREHDVIRKYIMSCGVFPHHHKIPVSSLASSSTAWRSVGTECTLQKRVISLSLESIMNLPIRLIGVTLLSIAVRTESPAVEDVSASNALNAFGLKFLAEAGRQLPKDTNLAISPYTVWTAMSIVNEGARGNTARELETTLFIPPNGTERQSFRQSQQRLIQNLKQKIEGVTLETLNSIFTRAEATLNPNYVQLVEQIYGVKVEALDFKNAQAAADHINQIISGATKGRLTKLVDADAVKDSFMFITSALFFKGLWDMKFDKELTTTQPFYNEQRQQIGTVDMMRTGGSFPFGYILNGKAIAVELPYIGGKLSMILVLPTSSNSVYDILRSIAETSIFHIVDQLKKAKEMFGNQVTVHLPRFKIATKLPLNDLLSSMGVVDVFDSSTADLGGVSESSLFVSRVMHETEIEVNEEGTTGSSATTLEVNNKSAADIFKANKPFAFFVVDKETKTLLFMGKVYNPSA